MMNHDGSQQYTFGYGLASTPQIQLQQQQQIQLQQHGFQPQQPQQILQHQGNPTIPAQNVFQLQVGGNPATALLQQNDQAASMAQHGLISQPVIHASISVSLDNSKPLQGLNSMEAAMVYSQQNNGLKIITNPGNFVQQPEIHFQSLDGMGKSNVFDGVAGGPQGTVSAGFGKQAFSGWIQRDVANQQYSVGQNTLPSFGHLWSHFQQHKTQVNIVQQQQQQLNQFQSQPHQFQSHHHHHPLGQPQQTPQFTVSGIQPVNSIQMIKVQPNSIQDQAVLQPTAHLIQQCAAAQLPNALAPTLTTSSPVPKQAQFKEIQASVSRNPALMSARPSNILKQSNEFVGLGSISGIPQKHNDPVVTSKKQSKSVQRKLKPSHSTLPSSVSGMPGMATSKDSQAKLDSSHSRMPAASDTVRIKPSNGKAFTESGPPKVTVTLDSLAQFPDKADSLPVIKVTEKVNKLSSRNHLNKTDVNQSMLWQQVHSGLHDKKNVLASNHLTSSTGSSLDRPSSEDSNFSSPPYSLTPPNSIDSVFSPPSFTKLIPDVQLTSDLLLPSSSSSALPPPTPSSEEAISNKMSSTSIDKLESCLDSVSPVQTPTFTSCLMSASCCCIAITTTSVTSSSPRVQGDIAVAASIHSFTPLSSPGVVDSKSHWLLDGPKTSGGANGQQCIKVPYSWQRKLEDGVVVYLSPSGAVLASLDEIREYLLSHDTCKCGLECPFQLEGAFVFDPRISNLPWSDASSDNGGMANLCNHRREIMAMAAFHQSQTQARQVVTDEENALVRKRESAKSLNSGDDLVVSPPKKLRTSITNAVNKHAMLRHNSTSGGNSLSSPLSESDNSWQKDDVFYPISTPPLSSKSTDTLSPMGGYPASDPSLSKHPGFQPCYKDGQPKGFSQNLVYSNHHPSQRLGAKGHHRHQQSQPHRHTPSPFSTNIPCLPLPVENPHAPTSSPSPMQQHPKSIHVFHSHKQTAHLPRQCQSGFSEHKVTPASTPNDSDAVFLPSHSDSKPSTTHNTQHTKYKGKGGNSKAKKDKQKLSSDFACNPSKPSAPKNSPLAFPPSSVSFLENPTVFVAQQAAIINSSISSCSNMGCPSPDNPSPPNQTMDQSVSLVSEEEDADDNLDTSREEEEDHKANTDVESNKSFSDTTENNDSAYLSQTGSDQEKSDTVDGLDCLSKSDIYDFSCSEDHIEGSGVRVVGTPTATSQPGLTSDDSSCTLTESCDQVDKCEVKVIDVDKEKGTVGGHGKNSGSKVKLKQNRTFKKKGTVPLSATSVSCVVDATCATNKSNVPNYPAQNVDVKCETNSLNGDLSQLLASNNWNIPALQKVLAQHSAGDPERLREAIQQVMTQITVSSDSNCGTNVTMAANNNNAQNVTVFNSVAKEIKQQWNNNNTSKHVTNGGGKSTMEPIKDAGDVLDQKNAGKTGHNTTNTNIDCKTVTPTAKGCVKLGEVAKPPPTYTRVFQSTSSLVGIPTTASISSSGMNTPQCSPQTSIILNHGKPQVMSINAASTMPQVSMNVVTNVSKPLSQVISNLGLNQTMLQTQPFLGTPHSRATQLLSHPPPQNTQIMNTLSIPGLNNSLVIANPIQQASPSSVAQLSPAMAAGQILAQGQQPPLQQMSPSFVPTAQIPKPCTPSMSSHPNLTISNASIPIASNSTVDVTTGTIPLTANSKDILNVFTGTRPPTLNQNTPVANAASVYSAANQPVFVIPQAKSVQPVVQLVGSSQALAPASGLQGDVTQLLNQATISDQTQQLQNLIAASSFNPLGIQQAWNTVNLNAQQQQQQQQQLQLLQLQQLMLPVLQNQNQALSGAVSACPSQSNTLMNAVVTQQGLQVNQAIQQTQGFNNPALSPVAQAAFPNQIQQMASPLTVQVGSAAPNPTVATINSQGRLSNPVNILQPTRPPANTVPKPTPIPTVPITAVQVASQPSSSSSNRIESVSKPVDKSSPHEVVNVLSQPEQAVVNSTVSTKSPLSNIPPAPKLSTAGKSASKSKSKSKKSDSSKVKDPQVAKDEEHIANAVNQILAQAVQQQRELSLAAQNQPPPPPKSRNRKRDSQARARAALQAKEQELGKIASISDDAVFHHQLQSPTMISPPVHLSSSSSLSSTSSLSSVSSQEPAAHLVNTSSFAMSSSSQSAIRPSHSSLNPTLPSVASSISSSSSSSSSLHQPHINISDSSTLHQHPNNSNGSQFGWQFDNKPSLPAGGGGSSSSSNNQDNAMAVKNIAHLPALTSDAASSLKKSSLNPTMKVKPSLSGPKKSVGISLKEHLSSIVVTNKDKESGRRKGEENNNPKMFGLVPSIPPVVALVNGGADTTSLALAADTAGNKS